MGAGQMILFYAHAYVQSAVLIRFYNAGLGCGFRMCLNFFLQVELIIALADVTFPGGGNLPQFTNAFSLKPVVHPMVYVPLATNPISPKLTAV